MPALNTSDEASNGSVIPSQCQFFKLLVSVPHTAMVPLEAPLRQLDNFVQELVNRVNDSGARLESALERDNLDEL